MRHTRRLRSPILIAVVGVLLLAAIALVVLQRGGRIPAACMPRSPSLALRFPQSLRSLENVYFNGGTTGLHYAIGRAWVGGTPANEQVVKLIQPRDSGWHADVVKDPYVVDRHRTLFLFYSGFSSSTDRWSIGLSTSSDRGKTWRDLGRPLLPPFRITTGAHPFPVVVPPNGSERNWTLFFAASGGIYTASSPDGFRWRAVHAPVLRPLSPDAGLDPGDVRRVGDRWLLIYATAKEPGPWQMRRAWARHLGGPYHDAGPISQAGPYRARLQVIANAPRGARVLAVTSATRLGPFLAVLADKHGWQLVHVLGISHSRATLAEALGTRFSRGARLVAVTSRSVDPKILIRQRGDDLLLATAFEALPGCLLEVSLVGHLRAQDARSPVVWDWDSAPLVPLGQGSGWHANSSENPAVVRTATAR